MDRNQLDRACAALGAALAGIGQPKASAVLYGSAARGDWVPDRSDVNLLVVVDDPSPASLARLAPALDRWHADGFTPPLLVGREEWTAAVDVFPIEITDMQLSHRVLSGDDPLAGIEVRRADLRLALETELRGKLMRLRQAWVRFGNQAPTLGGFAVASVAEMLVLLRCTAVLMGRNPGLTPADTVQALAAELGPDGGIVAEIASHRPAGEWSCAPEQFCSYLEVVRRVVDLIDHFDTGAE